jgi:hypothetical protein
MAILKKRTSSKQLPEARGLDRAPLGSIIRGVGNAPALTDKGASSITSAGGSGDRPFTSSFTNPATSKPALTSKPSTTSPSLTTKTSLNTKPSLTSTTNTPTTKTTSPTTTTKPTITNKTPTTPTTKTTSPTSVVKPTVKPNTTNTNSTTNKIVNALTGAALGAGTKLIIDKITGKPTVVKTGAGGTGTTGGTGGAKAPAGGTGGAKTPAGSTAKPPAGSTAKPPAGSTTKPPAGGTKPPVTSVTKPPVGGSGTADDVYKGTPADPSLGLPAGAIDNGDGTYTTVFDDGSSMTYSMEDGSVLYSTDTEGKIAVTDDSSDTTVPTDETGTGGTRGLGGTNTAENESETDTTVADNTDVEYFQDDYGNVYTMNEDGSYELYSDAGNTDSGTDYADNTYVDPDTGQTWTLAEDGTWSSEDDTSYADNTYTDPDTGAVWNMADNGEWTTDWTDDSAYYDDSLYADNTDYNDYTDYNNYNDYAEYTFDDGDYYGKRGGLITMMKKGGVPRFEEGGYSDTGEEVQDWQNVSYNYGEYDDPYLTGDNSLYTGSGGVNNSYLRDLALDEGEEVVNADYAGDEFTPVPGRQYFDDGSYIDTFDDGSTMTYDYDGNIVDTTDGYQTTRDDEGNYIVTDGYGNMTVYDPSGSVIPLGGGRVNQRPITSVGSGTKKPVVGNVLGPTGSQPNNLGSDFLNTITGALGTTAGAAGAGALIASLLGGDFGGGTGAQNQGLDMSQVGIINPRTTDFGIGPTNFVGYEDYGTSGGDYTPNEELLRNLNAPGYNPVREGDYGYEEVPAEEVEETPKMASGGLSSMATPVASYYTFGQPADILANLGMRAQPPMNPPEMMPQIGQQQQPQQTQQQGLPQQAPPQMAQQMPQGMPQQGIMPQQQGMAPPMRKGGLPHVSNVPLTQGRMDFRKGAAVHGAGDGQSDDIPAMLADGEYVIDAETVAQIGNGSTKAGAQALDKFREGIRAHKRSAPINKIPPKTKALTSYLKGAK